MSTLISISGSAAVSDQTIDSCCASRMFDPSEPVPSIRLPKNRNATMKSGSATAGCATAGRRGPQTASGSSRTRSQTASPSTRRPGPGPRRRGRASLPARISSGLAEASKHLDNLVLLLGRRALQQVAGRHQHRQQEEHRERDRQGKARDRHHLTGVLDFAGSRPCIASHPSAAADDPRRNPAGGRRAPGPRARRRRTRRAHPARHPKCRPTCTLTIPVLR